MDCDAVMEQFRHLSGLSEEEAAGWKTLCEAAISHLQSILREGVDLKANADRLHLAAAGCAFYRYCLMDGAAEGKGQRFRLGELSLEENASDRRKAAATLEQELLCLVSDLTRPGCFVFRQVGGYGF